MLGRGSAEGLETRAEKGKRRQLGRRPPTVSSELTYKLQVERQNQEEFQDGNSKT